MMKGKLVLTLDAQISRRTAVRLMAALAAAGSLPGSALAAAPADRFGPATPFDWNRLVAMARALARKAHAPVPDSRHAAPDFDSSVALTYGAADPVAGNVRLFPTSRVNAPKPVRVHIVKDGQAREVIDTRGLFVGSGTADPAGFRVMDATGRSDWMAYMGASYFRSSGSRDQYGLSARGIAVDTGLAGGEEFPAFTQFWVEETGPDSVRVEALLDGESLTGAFAFDCRRSATGVVQDVKATLFLRKNIEQLGLAPASSMFWYDQASPAKGPDWRPEIHDSDGLAIWSGNGERVWRPLRNPAQPQLQSFRADSPRGFGLIQRDQAFDHYQDDGAFYERRPALWVEPKGDWGPGAVGLFEMPTDNETLDNVAMFWKSDRPARAGERRDFAYRLTWTSEDPSAAATARLVDHFVGQAGIPGGHPVAGARKYVFDFAGPALAGLDRESGVAARTDLPDAAILAAAAYPVARSEGIWRVMLDLRTAALPRPEFRLYLARGDAALSETVIRTLDP